MVLATSAYAVPAPQLLGPRGVSSGNHSFGGGSSSDLTLGGVSGFGSSFSAPAMISVPVRIGGDGGYRNDSYRHARYSHNHVHSVPEPGTTWLMGAGLLGLLFVSRRTLRTAR